MSAMRVFVYIAMVLHAVCGDSPPFTSTLCGKNEGVVYVLKTHQQQDSWCRICKTSRRTDSCLPLKQKVYLVVDQLNSSAGLTFDQESEKWIQEINIPLLTDISSISM